MMCLGMILLCLRLIKLLWSVSSVFIKFRQFWDSSMGSPGGASGKEPTYQWGRFRDSSSVPRWERSPGEGWGNPLWCSCLDNPMDRGTWWATVHRVTKSRTWLKWLSKHGAMMYPCPSQQGRYQWRPICEARIPTPPGGEGNGNPLQCSCLDNPMDRGAWRAAVHRVAQGWTWLKWLSSSSSSQW